MASHGTFWPAMILALAALRVLAHAQASHGGSDWLCQGLVALADFVWAGLGGPSLALGNPCPELAND